MQLNSTINAQHANTIIHAGDVELLHMQQETALWEKIRFAGAPPTNNEDFCTPFPSLRVTGGDGMGNPFIISKTKMPKLTESIYCEFDASLVNLR